MKFHGIRLEEGSAVTNMTVASGTAFPDNPNEGELFFRSDAAPVKGLYAYVGGSWNQISNFDSAYVNITGDTMSGTLTLPSNGLVVGTNQLVVSGGKVGIGTSTPSGTLDLVANAADYALKLFNNGASFSRAGIQARGGSNTEFYGLSVNTFDSSVEAHFRVAAGSIPTVGSSTAHPLAFATSNTERMRIDSSGNVGIGTTAGAGFRLHTLGGNVRFESAAASTVLQLISSFGTSEFGTDSTGLYLAPPSTRALRLFSGGAERLRIDNSGNTLIGLTASTGTYALEVAGNVRAGAFYTNTTGNGAIWNTQAGNLIFGTNNLERLRIDASGNLGIGTATPFGQFTVNAGIGAALMAVTATDLPTAVQRLGGVVFGSQADNKSAARIEAYSEAAWTAGTSNPTYMVFRTTPTASATHYERMRIDSAGNVGIGLSPSARLHVDAPVGGISTALILTNSLTNATQGRGTDILFTGTGGSTLARVRASTSTTNNTDGALQLSASGATGFISFVTNGTERVKIDSVGNVGIGVTPSVKLHTRTDGAGLDTVARIERTNGSDGYSLNFNLDADANVAEIRAGGTQMGALAFATSNTERLRIDASGNLGLGVIPSAWLSTYRTEQVGLGASIAGRTGIYSQVEINANAYVNSGGAATYIGTENASRYQQSYGSHTWFTAPSGTAGTAISFTQAMTLDPSGNVGLGVTPSAWGGTLKAIEGQSGGYFGFDANNIHVGLNNYWNGSAFVYKTNGLATNYYQNAGGHFWRIAGSGTAGGTISWSTPLRIDSTGNVLVTGSGGLGYGTGSGGAVTQITSRTTGVTLNKTNGAITLVSAAGTATWQSFTVTNSSVAATDVVNVCQKSGTDLYMIHVTEVAAGSFRVSFATTGGTTTEQPVFNFVVMKAVAA